MKVLILLFTRLFWQDRIGLCNAKNPAGQVTSSHEYTSLLIVAVVVSFAVSIKRCFVGLTLGRQTYCKYCWKSLSMPVAALPVSSSWLILFTVRYGEDLARVMRKALLVGQLASLARDLQIMGINLADMGLKVKTDDDLEGTPSTKGIGENDAFVPKSGLLEGLDISSRRARIDELLGEFEEPEDKGHIMVCVD